MKPVDPQLEAAIEWMVLFRAGPVSAEHQARFAAWRLADPRHAAAWDEVSGALERTFGRLRQNAEPTAAADALRRPFRRKLLRNTLGAALAVAGLGMVARRHPTVRAMSADLRTGTAQRRKYVLSDGSELTLDAESAADLAFSGGQRRIHLLSGALHVRVAADAARPFTVVAGDGEVRALGTVFMVAREGATSVAVVEEHAIEVSAGGARRILREGEGARFGASGIGASDPVLADRAAWRQGMLIVRNEPLGRVIEALRPYRRGMLRISAAAARLRVLGAYPLDAPDTVLAALEQTLPIRVAFHSDWLVTVALRDE